MSVRDGARERAVLAAFQRTAATMPWYRTLLAEHGVRAGDVVDAESFARCAPVLTRHNTFDRFPIADLAATTPLRELGGVLTSSGHGGRFSFGLMTRAQDDAGAAAIDRAFDAAFEVASRATLAINCLPMGVGFRSSRMTVATTSVREDMVVALVQTFGGAYEQVVVATDPLFLKRLTDHAAAAELDWARHRVQVVIGEEIFGECFREYMAGCLGLHLDRPGGGWIMSSFGVGELGLHLCYETRATVAVRRAAHRHPMLARELFGGETETMGLPAVLAFDAGRTHLEALAPDGDGYGLLTVSMLDPDLPIPLLRYQPGDVVRPLDRDEVAGTLRRHGIDVPADLPADILALRGRAREAIPGGAHVGLYKDALYADPEVARTLTGACRIVASDDRSCTLHVQRTPASSREPSSPGDDVERRLLEAIPARARPARVVAWPYHRFPFGMTLDYERKFSCYVPGDTDPLPDGEAGGVGDR